MTDTNVTSTAPDLAELAKGIAVALADDPARVRMESDTTQDEVVLHLTVSPDDLGKVLGKQGRTARSLRAIVGAAATRQQVHCTVDIRSEE